MSPMALDSTASLAVLLAELRKDREAVERQLTELEALRGRWGDVEREAPLLAYACVLLHGWYTGLESLFERIARTVDGHVPTGERSHRALLRQMTVELPGVRGPIIASALEGELAELLKFRHFFRHAYAVTLDPKKVRAEADRVSTHHAEVARALDAVEAFLTQSLTALARQ